jgi:bifunctional DNA-binding transcriptional regulator/antitoxin component of YhaV-PrlF toxin-antitoxin module
MEAVALTKVTRNGQVTLPAPARRERFDLGTNRWRIISSKNKARQLYIRSIRSNWRVLQTVIAGRARIY